MPLRFLQSPIYRRNIRPSLPWSACLLLAILLSFVAAAGHTLVTITTDTARYLLSAILSVSGSILGFLVFYLTFAFEGIRRFFGRHSNSVFRRDPFIWLLCVFFSAIIIISFLALSVVDYSGWGWRWIFNFCCFIFFIGISMIVPFGRTILNRTDTAIEIRYLIDSITLKDFREPPQQNWYLGPSHWIIHEERDNPVDKVSAILLHNIKEKNNSVVANMISALFKRIQLLMGTTADAAGERAILRHLDILLLAFDQAKDRTDPLVFKLIFSNYQATGELLARKNFGSRAVEHLFNDARTMIQYWIEAENEQLAFDSLWMYYHLCRSQLQKNLPPEDAIYQRDADGEITPILAGNNFESDRKFDQIRTAVTYELAKLIDRAFLCKSKFITEDAVHMMRAFLEMVVVEGIPSPILEEMIGGPLSYYTLEMSKALVAKEKTSLTGFLGLFIGHSHLVDLLRRDTKLTRSVFSDWVSLARYLIDNDYYIPYDLQEIGGLGRMIVARSVEIPDILHVMTALVDLLQSARRKILITLHARKTIPIDSRPYETIKSLDHDLRSWLSRYPRANVSDDRLSRLLQRNQW